MFLLESRYSGGGKGEWGRGLGLTVSRRVPWKVVNSYDIGGCRRLEICLLNFLPKAGSLVMCHFCVNKKVHADLPHSVQGEAVCSRIPYCLAIEESICFNCIQLLCASQSVVFGLPASESPWDTSLKCRFPGLIPDITVFLY